MEILAEIFSIITNKLYLDNKYTRILDKVEEKCRFNRLYIFSVLAFIVAVYTAIGYGKEFLCTFTSIVYPIYASVAAIEQNNLEETKALLVYWVIFALVHLFEIFFDFIIIWIPYYWPLKMLFLFFCFVPVSNNLSVFLYRNFLLELMKCATLQNLEEDSELQCCTEKESFYDNIAESENE